MIGVGAWQGMINWEGGLAFTVMMNASGPALVKHRIRLQRPKT
jgi:hypothetical protein